MLQVFETFYPRLKFFGRGGFSDQDEPFEERALMNYVLGEGRTEGSGGFEFQGNRAKAWSEESYKGV